MVESANTSATPNLLTARNAILAVSVVFAVSLIWACVDMLHPNDSGGMGHDSYGTRADGFRGLYETLEELHVPVNRGLAPPRSKDDYTHTLALLGPDRQLLLFEPKYLKATLAWVDAGGRLVVAPSQRKGLVDQPEDPDIPGERDILKLLEIDDSIVQRDEEAEDAATASNNYRPARPKKNQKNAPDDFWAAWSYSQPDPREVKVESTGSLAHLAKDVRRIAAPGDEFATLVAGSKKPAGAVQFKNADGNDSLLIAVLPRGKGEIVVVSDPALFSNSLIAKADNSVLAAHVLTPQGGAVDFDEYYHGLAVRGNPLYLLTRPGFAATAIGILLVIGVVAWRAAVFLGPPLSDGGRSRRDIQEYVQAMGAFFCRGPGHRRFLVREIRDGVLRELCEQLRLPAQTTDTDKIAAALARRFPDRAAALRKALADVDGLLADAGAYPKALFLSSVQHLAGCL
jgi:Domain of unknown function (DUF4350)